MAEYFYLVSSLPFLQFKEPSLIKHGQFLKDCSMWLSEGDMEQVRHARVDIEHIPLEKITNRTLWSWIVFENSVRNELVRIRAGQMGVTPENFLRTHIDSDPTVIARVRDAAKEPSPHKAELLLLELRWNFLENLEVGHGFDVTGLIIYGLKLQLLERKMLFNVENGQKVFHIIYEGNKDEEERKYRENQSR